MSWSQIADGEVLDEFTPQEQATLNAIQGGSKLAGVLQRTINKVRGSITAGGGQIAAEALTVPDQLRTEVIDIARWRWLISFPQLKALQTPERKAAADAAEKTIKEVAKGEIKVEVPDVAADATAPGNAVEAKANPRISTHDKMDGLS